MINSPCLLMSKILANGPRSSSLILSPLSPSKTSNVPITKPSKTSFSSTKNSYCGYLNLGSQSLMLMTETLTLALSLRRPSVTLTTNEKFSTISKSNVFRKMTSPFWLTVNSLPGSVDFFEIKKKAFLKQLVLCLQISAFIIQ